MTIGKSDEARRDILGRIRRARGLAGASPADREIIETYLRAHPRGPIRELEGDPVARFVSAAIAQQCTATEVRDWKEIPRAVAGYLAAASLPARGCAWPALREVDFASAGLDFALRGAEPDDPVGVTGAFAALAETGTLMLVSGPETPATVSLLPETHIAVVRASCVVPCMEDAWDLARRAFGRLPRAINFVSGPSRTGDIEQKMVLGVHGPYRVHVIIVREA
jgi:L-lactate dehydrogenase complex protein LldG